MGLQSKEKRGIQGQTSCKDTHRDQESIIRTIFHQLYTKQHLY